MKQFSYEECMTKHDGYAVRADGIKVKLLHKETTLPSHFSGCIVGRVESANPRLVIYNRFGVHCMDPAESLHTPEEYVYVNVFTTTDGDLGIAGFPSKSIASRFVQQNYDFSHIKAAVKVDKSKIDKFIESL